MASTIFSNAETDCLARCAEHLPPEHVEKFLCWAAQTRLHAEILNLALAGRIQPHVEEDKEIEWTVTTN